MNETYGKTLVGKKVNVVGNSGVKFSGNVVNFGRKGVTVKPKKMRKDLIEFDDGNGAIEVDYENIEVIL